MSFGPAPLLVVLSLLAAGCAGDKPAHAPDAPGHGGGHGAHAHHGPVQHRFEDPERWAEVFEAPDRDAWQKPDQVIDALALPHGAKVADIGSATGYFPIRIAKARPDVTVFGADVEASMAGYLEARAKREGLTNVIAVHAAADDPRLPEKVSLVLLVDTYHHIAERPAYFARLRKGALRPGARVAIIDFKQASPRGPPAEHKIAAEQVIKEMEAAGFTLIERHGFLPDQYFLVFSARM